MEEVTPCEEGNILKTVFHFLDLQQKICNENLVLIGIIMSILLRRSFKLGINFPTPITFLSLP